MPTTSLPLVAPAVCAGLPNSSSSNRGKGGTQKGRQQEAACSRCGGGGGGRGGRPCASASQEGQQSQGSSEAHQAASRQGRSRSSTCLQPVALLLVPLDRVLRRPGHKDAHKQLPGLVLPVLGVCACRSARPRLQLMTVMTASRRAPQARQKMQKITTQKRKPQGHAARLPARAAAQQHQQTPRLRGCRQCADRLASKSHPVSMSR